MISVKRGLLLTYITHKIQISMSPVGFEPAIPASEQPQIDAIDHVAIGTDLLTHNLRNGNESGDLESINLTSVTIKILLWCREHPPLF
jgi:hypothetical protein